MNNIYLLQVPVEENWTWSTGGRWLEKARWSRYDLLQAGHVRV